MRDNRDNRDYCNLIGVTGNGRKISIELAIALYIHFRIEIFDTATYISDANLREEGLIQCDDTFGL
jgi:hypothetical protein